MGIPIGEANQQLERARRLAGRCRAGAALRECNAVLRNEPENSHALALKARLEVARDHTSVEEATQLTERLIAQSPDDSYLQVAKALLLIRGRDRDASIAELRIVAAMHAKDPYVHQVLAGLLGCNKATWPEAWEHWKIALEAGPLLTPAYKGAAYFLARRLEPELAPATLSGTSRLERLVVRTRALGVPYLLDGFLIVLILGALVGSKSLGVGVALGLLAMVWALWSAFANFYIGCWKCFTVWIVLSAAVWPAFVYTLKQPIFGFFFLVSALISSAVQMTKARGITLPHEKLSAELQRRSTSGDR